MTRKRNPINVRSVRFGFRGAVSRQHHAERPMADYMLNAVSAFLPHGEAFFVRSIRSTLCEYGSAIPPHLLVEAEAFCKQELAHSGQHRLYNIALAERYPVMLKFDRYVKNAFTFLQATASTRLRLAYTVAAEHLTSTLARTILENPEILSDCDQELVTFWKWHALEELEHRSVAYDLHISVGGGSISRTFAFLTMAIPFVAEYLVILALLLHRDRVLFQGRTLRALWSFFRSKLFVRGIREALRFLHPRSRPDDHQDASLIRAYQKDLLIESHTRTSRPINRM